MASVEEILAAVKHVTNATIIVVVAGATNTPTVKPVDNSFPPMPVAPIHVPHIRTPLPRSTNDTYAAYQRRMAEAQYGGKRRNQ